MSGYYNIWTSVIKWFYYYTYVIIKQSVVLMNTSINLIMLISFSQVLGGQTIADKKPHMPSGPSSSDGNVQLNLAQQIDPGITNLVQLLG